MLDLSHPANAKVVAYLKNPYRFYQSSDALGLQRLRQAREKELAKIEPVQPADHSAGHGTHPDLAKRLWKDITADLPVPCAWVVYRHPVLAHPKSGVIFGWAEGTHVYTLRLPPRERAEAFSAGAKTTHLYPAEKMTLDVTVVGPEWVLGAWSKSDRAWCLGAFRFAA
jgi:hypothetical protein